MTATIEELKLIAQAERLKVKALGAYIIDPGEDDGDCEDENERTLSPAGRRMARKRRRERNARLFWELRLKTGTTNLQLIKDCLAKAPKIVEDQRIKTIKRLAGFARAYPERAEQVKGE
jgi:hypothetical protein